MAMRTHDPQAGNAEQEDGNQKQHLMYLEKRGCGLSRINSLICDPETFGPLLGEGSSRVVGGR